MNKEQNDRLMLLALRSLLENSSEMIFIKDENLVYMAASRSFARLVGYDDPKDMIGKTDFDFFEPALAQKYIEDDRGILASGGSILEYIEPLPEQNGKKSYSSTSKYIIRDEEGKVIGLYGMARDVTAQVELEAERESSSLSRQMFDNVLEADLTENRMLRAEGDGWIRALNITGSSTFSQTVKKMAGRFVHSDYVGEFLAYYDIGRLKAAYKRGDHEISHVTCLCMEDGNYRWVEYKSRIYHSRVSNTLRITTFLKDVDDEIRHKQRLQKKANTDALTGLYNRESVWERISSNLENQQKGRTDALLFIDLDHFKQVNDHWGHQFGDKVLQKTADRLRQIFRETDIFGRIGGDEFIAYLKDVPSKEIVEKRAKEVVEALLFRYVEDETDVCVTCSVGIALCRNGETGLERLYEQADRAMYRAKECGRNRICFYEGA